MILKESDNDLWTEFISGSQSAFSHIYDRYADVLYAFGLRYTSDGEMVKDCIHDLFIDLHQYRSGLASEVNVKFYLLKSFKRKLHAACRKSSLVSLNGWGAEESIPIAAFSFSIEHDIILDEKQREMLHLLATHINLLPDRQREILYLKFTHNLEYEEIASIMQISVPTCRTFVYRALKELRGKLELTSMLLLMMVLK
jgi:RNA polymerase sigma factor (sigma-70 family)